MTSGLKVDLGSRSYPIHFVGNAGVSVLALVQELSTQSRPVALLTDQGVLAAQRDLIERTLSGVPKLVVHAGESSKSLESLGRVLDFLAGERMSRKGVLLVLGGGVVGDLGGFAAASFLRGIEYVQIPTTLLAMVDSSVGGKTGINLTAGKNLVGAFHHPQAVYVATDFLATLPAREFAAGAAEVIKYGLLGDAALFAQLEKSPITARSAELPQVIRRCCEMKAAVVRADERETAAEGGRALLNLGHTFGHAIEQVTGYGTYLHGEAVGVGLAAAARLSQALDYLSAADVARVDRVVAAHGLPTRLREKLSLPALMAAMQSDKKVRAGQLRFVVLKRLGEAATQGSIDLPLVDAVWRELGAA